MASGLDGSVFLSVLALVALVAVGLAVDHLVEWRHQRARSRRG